MKILTPGAETEIDNITNSSFSSPKGNENREFRSRRRLHLRRTAPEYLIRDPHSLKIVAKTAATLSHEINNPLMAITGIVERLLAKETELTPEMKEKIRQVGEAAARIRDVTERLMDIDALYFRPTAAGLMIDLDKVLHSEENVPAIGESEK
ncbi:hypothetical protein TRIP_C21270 [Candidatus Zixiibacteriota bacterium]|nr:hypothetical protein TRIP_C21270 [candidate division Zixibacteria bacterium]